MPETKTNIYAALMQAQKDMGPVLKNATNPAFRSKYADLSSVIETITEPLHNNGLTFYQNMIVDSSGPQLVTHLVHIESGESIDSWSPIVCKDPQDPQKVGGAITYMRRYALLALLGLSPEDDDGNAASSRSAAPATAAPAQAGQSVRQPTSAPSRPAPAPRPAPPVAEDDHECEIVGCSNVVEGRWVAKSKRDHNGRVLCWTHSKEAAAGGGEREKEGYDRPSVRDEADEWDNLMMREGLA